MSNLIKIIFIILLSLEISLLKSQQTIVEVDKIVETNLNQTIPIIGTITYKKNSNLMAPVSGIVGNIMYDEGTCFEKKAKQNIMETKNQGLVSFLFSK